MCSTREDGADIDDPVAGGNMLYTSGTTGRPKGVYKPPDPRAALDVARLTAYRPDRHVHLCTGPLYHAAPLAFSLAAPASMGVADRPHGRVERAGDAAPHRRARRHAHAHGADDVSPAALTARRREGAPRSVVARVHHPRRRTVSGRREAAAHRVARPHRVGVLRGDGGLGHRRRLRGMAAQAGHGRAGGAARSHPHSRRRRPRPTAGRGRERVPEGTRGRQLTLRVLQGARQDRRRVPGRVLHARRRRIRRRGRLPVPHRSQRPPHHQRRRQHLPRRGRGGAPRASRGR